MMRRIVIVGASQAGLHLALRLQKHGYAVTVVNDRTASDVQHGAIMAVQCQSGSSLALEQSAGLDLWSSVGPPLEGATFEVVDASGEVTDSWHSRLTPPGVAIDQRVKLSTWMRLFEARGGELRYARVGLDDLETYAQVSDLVLVTTGRSDVARLFNRDVDRSPIANVPRFSMLLCVKGMDERPASQAISYSMMPGLGDFVTLPGLTTAGPCHFMLLQTTPDGPLDGWTTLTTPDEYLAFTKSWLAQWLPWQGEAYAEAELTDERAVFRTRVTPMVRYPVVQLPSRALIAGMGECLVQTDPLTLQGADLATQFAEVYLEQILDHGRQRFDRAWMEFTFERFWSEVYTSARATGDWRLKTGPPPASVFNLRSRVALTLDDTIRLHRLAPTEPFV